MTVAQMARVAGAILFAQGAWMGAAAAQDQGTPEEAQAMAEQAAALLQAEGEDVAFDAFNNGPEFHDRDLYVFVMDDEGNMLAHGANEALIGRNVADLRDPTGRLFIQEFISIEDTGWVDYQWQNPVSNAVEPKTSYIVNVDGVIVGVGAYTE